MCVFARHREMDETEECPEYIILNEVRRGCRFPHQSLLEFSQFNMCVNGSSPAGSLRAAFFSLDVQNYGNYTLNKQISHSSSKFKELLIFLFCFVQ